MSLEIRPFARPEWSRSPSRAAWAWKASCSYAEGFFIAMLRFPEHATIHEHPGEVDTFVACIDGSGFTSVGGETAPIAAGQQVRWPAGVPHRLWTEATTMTTLMIERSA